MKNKKEDIEKGNKEPSKAHGKEEKEENKTNEKHECKEEEYRKKAEEYKEIAQRLQAEFENYKKRMEARYDENAKFCSSEIIRQILPFMDSLDAAIANIEKSEKLEKKDVIEGMKGLREQMMKILKDNGCEEIKAEGKFNHELHECVSTTYDEKKEDECIVKELRKGYTLHKRVLRPSMVEVNKIELRKNEDDKKEEVSKNG